MRKRAQRNYHNMKPLSSKRMVRIEKKKKKMAALVEISKLNEHDRKNKCLRIPAEEPDNSSKEAEPSPKRLRTEESVKHIDHKPSDSVPELAVENKKTDGSAEIGPSGKPKLSGEELIKLKKLLRENTAKFRQTPRFWLREQGECAVLSVDAESRVPLFLSDVQHLLLYSQLGHHSPYNPARWCQLDKFSKLKNTNLLVVENVSINDFLSNESQLPFLSSAFNVKLEVLSSSTYKGDIVQDITMVPLTRTQMKSFMSKYGTLERAVSKTDAVFDIVKNMFPVDKDETTTSASCPVSDKFPRTHLLLSGWQMVEENFPLPIKGLMEHKYSGYVLTKDHYKEVTAASPMFGMDCEMCKTSTGELELTRVSIVDENLKEFYEQLVKPDNKIIDYLTRFSGITPKLMGNVTKRLRDVQEDIRKLLPADAILVGQSLGNDLHALKMMHPYVIDTSVIYNLTGNRTRKTKLQTLSREFLNIRIQEGRRGHCSSEDSAASLSLVKHKLTKSLYYGDAVMSNVQLQIRQQPELGHPNFATSMLKHSTRMDKTALIVGLEDTISKYNYYTYKDSRVEKVDKKIESEDGVEEEDDKKIKCVPEKSNSAVIQTLCDSLTRYSLNIGHVILADGDLDRDKPNTLQNVDGWVKQIYERSGVPSLNIVIFGGQQDTANGCCFIGIKTV